MFKRILFIVVALSTWSIYAQTSTPPLTGKSSSGNTYQTAALNPPALANIEVTALSYTEGDPATAITITIAVSDVDNTTLVSGTVSITSGLTSSQDVLSFTNDGSSMGNITASYSAATGVLTMTSSGATATLAQWQSALRAVNYRNTSQDPSTSTRTISFTVNDGSNNSNTVTRNITITALNNDPTATGLPTTLTAIEDQSSGLDLSGISFNDSDIESGNLTLKLSVDAGTFALSNPAQNSLTATGNGTGSVTITGTIANLEAYLSRATNTSYYSAHNAYGMAAATLTIKVNDNGNTGSGGGSDVTLGTVQINITAVNDPPVLTTSSNVSTFIQSQSAVPVDDGITVADVDNTTLSSASLSITGNFQAGNDVLAFTNTSGMGNISASYNSSTGVLTLVSSSATATVAQWQTALQVVTYSNNSSSPTATGNDRTISIVVNDGTNNSSTVTKKVNIELLNQNPSASGIPASISQTEDVQTVAGFSSIIVSDPDAGSGKVTIKFSAESGTMVYALGIGITQTGIASKNVTFTGTITDLNFFLSIATNILYTPAQDLNGPGADHITVTLNDNGNTGYGGGNNIVVGIIPINIAAVNDPPINHLPAAQYAVKNVPFVFSSANVNQISISDVDAGTGIMQTTLTATHGSLTLNGTTGLNFGTGTGTNDATMNFSGRMTAINNALNGMTFTPEADYLGDGSLQITTNDNGNSGAGGALSDNDVLTIHVTLPVMVVSGNSITIANGDTTPDPVDWTDFGRVNISAKTKSFLYDIENTGTGYLDLAGTPKVAISGPNASDFNVTINPLSPINANDTTDFQITFNPSATGIRSATVSIVSNDPVNSPYTFAIQGNGNAPPILGGIDSSALNYSEGDVATPIASTITVTDVNDSTLANGTVSITSNFSSGEDILGFTNTGGAYGNITATYNASTGILSLTSSGATATLAQWQSALRAVTYKNTSSNPSTAQRIISFRINDGITNSNKVARNITINIPPLLANLETKVLSFTEGDTATPITFTISVSDSNNSNIDSATVQITSNYVNGEDTLSYSQVGIITGTFDAAKGKMTLTGIDSKANYQAALRSVKYRNLSDNPSTKIKTVIFYVNDGFVNSDTLSRNISVISVNDPPVLTNIESSSIHYKEGDAAVTVTDSITVSDVDNTNMDSAVVYISSNYVKGEDTLSYTKIGGITGIFESSEGKLFLTRTDTKLNYQSVLRAVKYSNLSLNPSPKTRVLSIYVNDGKINSDTLARKIGIATVNNAPVLANLENTNLNFTEGNPAEQITKTITISDVDNTNIDSALISINVNYFQGEDTLVYSKVGNISSTFNSSLGKLLLTGSDTKANYQSAFRSVKYLNTSNNPSTSVRSISFYANDGILNSDTLTRNITVISVNNAPVLLGIENSDLIYTEGSNSANVSNTINISDVDNTNMKSAVVSIVSNYVKGEDILTYIQVGNISGAFDASAGEMILSGKDTKANYVSALRNVKYMDNSSNPSTVKRELTFYVNDGTVNSDTLTRNIIVSAVDNAPVLADIESKPLTIKQGQTSYQITATLTLSDVDNSDLDSAVIKITSNYAKGKDTLLYEKTGNISGEFDVKNASLILIGKDTKANYQSAIRSIKYENGKSTPLLSNRTISISVSDGKLNSNVLSRDIIIVPSVSFLYYNYPNPFNPSTTITYSLPEKSRVHLILYDILGRRVMDMVNEEEAAGYYKYKLNSGSLASGVYIYVLSTESDNGKKFFSAKKMLLLK